MNLHCNITLLYIHLLNANTSHIRAVWGEGLLPSVCWVCGFESRRGLGRVYLVNVVCCQTELSAWAWSLIQGSPTDCGVSECDRESSLMRWPYPTGGLLCHKKNPHTYSRIVGQSQWKLRLLSTEIMCKYKLTIYLRNFEQGKRKNIYICFLL